MAVTRLLLKMAAVRESEKRKRNSTKTTTEGRKDRFHPGGGGIYRTGVGFAPPPPEQETAPDEK